MVQVFTICADFLKVRKRIVFKVIIPWLNLRRYCKVCFIAQLQQKQTYFAVLKKYIRYWKQIYIKHLHYIYIKMVVPALFLVLLFASINSEIAMTDWDYVWVAQPIYFYEHRKLCPKVGNCTVEFRLCFTDRVQGSQLK